MLIRRLFITFKSRNLFQTVHSHLMRPSYIYKHFCTFITQINNEDDYAFDSMHITKQVFLRYPHNEINNLRDLHSLKKWKKKKLNEAAFTVEQLRSVYSSLIAKCIDLKEFEYGRTLFEEAKEGDCLAIVIYTTMFHLIYKQYLSQSGGRYSLTNKAVKVTKKLSYEMEHLHGFKRTPVCYGLILRIYVSFNEYALAEETWKDYLNDCDSARQELFFTKEYNTDQNLSEQHAKYQRFKLNLENSVVWNYVLSLYRRQNKMDKVFEIYDTILSYNVMKVSNTTFVQVLVAISQIIETQKEKAHNIQKENDICHKYVVYAEKILIDALKLGDNVHSPYDLAYSYLFNSLLQCYASNGSFDKKCRNFWKYLYGKNVKYVFEAFDESNHSEIDGVVLNKLKSPPDLDEFGISQTLLCIKNCCQCTSKYDRVTDYDIYPIIDEMFNVFEERVAMSIKNDYGKVFFNFLEICGLLLQNMGHSNANMSYLYMFKFYNYYEIFKVNPSKAELSTFTNKAFIFFKYHKSFSSKNAGHLNIIHGCTDRTKFVHYINQESKKYKIDPKLLVFNPKKNRGHLK